MAKLQEIVVKNEHGYQPQQLGGAGLRHEKLTREELSRALDDKDGALQRLKQDMSGLERQLAHMKERNGQLSDTVYELQNALEVERQHVELKAKVKELERVRKELQEKDSRCEKLRNAVDTLCERMQKYEIEKSGASEDKKMQQMSEELKRKEQDNEVTKIKAKMLTLEQSRKVLQDDLK